EVDGVEAIRPVETESVSISVAQRYVFLLHTTNQVGDFLIRAVVWKCFNSRDGKVTWGGNLNPFTEAWMGDVTGILRYSNDNTDTLTMSSELHPYTTQLPEFNT